MDRKENARVPTDRAPACCGSQVEEINLGNVDAFAAAIQDRLTQCEGEDRQAEDVEVDLDEFYDTDILDRIIGHLSGACCAILSDSPESWRAAHAPLGTSRL